MATKNVVKRRVPSKAEDRQAVLDFAQAIKTRAKPKSDEWGDFRLAGKQGHIYSAAAGGARAYQLVFFSRYGVNDWDGSGPHVEDYQHAKRRLAFCKFTQTGPANAYSR